MAHPVFQTNEADLAGEAHMRRAARAKIHPRHLHDAHRHRELLFLTERHRRKLFLRRPADVYGKIFPHVLIHKPLEPHELRRVKLAVKVDRRAVLVHVKAHVPAAPKRMRMAGHQMLGRMDLHARKPRLPVQLAGHFRTGDKRGVAEVEDLAPLLARIRHARAAERADIAALSAALGEEGRAIQRHGKETAALFAREDARGEFPQMRVGVKQLFGHGIQNLKRFRPVTPSLKRSTVPSITWMTISHVALTRAAFRCPPTTAPDSFAALICRWL